MLEPFWAKLGNEMHIDSGNYTTIPSATIPSDHLYTRHSPNEILADRRPVDCLAGTKESSRIPYYRSGGTGHASNL